MPGKGIKPWEELTIQDDYMFKFVMNKKPICKEMLERILHIKIRDITYMDKEKSVKAGYGSKGVRLDVYVKDEKNTVYNVEMQMKKPEGEGLAKRTRYYQSMIDVDLLAAGQDYDELNPSIIIFICPFALFEGGRHIYTFRSLCVEDTGIELGDGAEKIFLSTKGTQNDIDEKAKAFLNYIDGIWTDDDLVRSMDEEIRRAKRIEAERVNYMTYEMKMKEERKEGRAEGLKEGLQKGMQKGLQKGLSEGKLEMVKSMLTNGLSIETICRVSGWTEESVRRLACAE